MADAAAKREARRRRILENSDSRLQKITGRLKESHEDTHNNSSPYFCQETMSPINNESNESKTLLEEKRKDFLERNNIADILDFEIVKDNNEKYDAFESLPVHISQKKDHDVIDETTPILINTNNQKVQSDNTQNLVLSVLILSPVSYILLAVIVHLLFVTNFSSSLNMGIIVPYLILAFTKMYINCTSEENKGSSLLITALILCNVKPEIVYTLKKLIMLTSEFTHDLALYLTCFVLLNCLTLIISENFLYAQLH